LLLVLLLTLLLLLLLWLLLLLSLSLLPPLFGLVLPATVLAAATPKPILSSEACFGSAPAEFTTADSSLAAPADGRGGDGVVVGATAASEETEDPTAGASASGEVSLGPAEEVPSL
jgi:hypothetical protein